MDGWSATNGGGGDGGFCSGEKTTKEYAGGGGMMSDITYGTMWNINKIKYNNNSNNSSQHRDCLSVCLPALSAAPSNEASQFVVVLKIIDNIRWSKGQFVTIIYVYIYIQFRVNNNGPSAHSIFMGRLRSVQDKQH